MFIGSDVVVFGSGALTPHSFAGQVNGDRELLVVTAGLVNAPISLSDPQGFALVGTQAVSLFSGLYQTVAVYQRAVSAGGFVNGRMPSPTVADTNSFNSAVIYCFRGPTNVCSVDTVQNDVNNGFGTSLNTTTLPTATNNELIAYIIGGYSGGANSISVTNGLLGGVTEQRDGYYAIGSDYQISSLTTGIKTLAGGTGAASATTAGNAILAAITVALKPS